MSEQPSPKVATPSKAQLTHLSKDFGARYAANMAKSLAQLPRKPKK